jgi:hypothetical protein
VFDLTPEEHERSARWAMRIAGADVRESGRDQPKRLS